MVRMSRRAVTPGKESQREARLVPTTTMSNQFHTSCGPRPAPRPRPPALSAPARLRRTDCKQRPAAGGGGAARGRRLEEGEDEVGEDVDAELHGEGDGEEVLERVEGGDGLRADVSVGQLRLEDVGEEAEEDEDGDQGLRREAAVRRSQAVLGLADEPWPRLLEQDGVLRGVANHLDPGAAVLYSLRIKKISPAAVK